MKSRSEQLSISLPGDLIDILDKVCGMKDFSRSCFIKKAIKRYILHQLDCPKLWDELYQRLMDKY